MQYKLSKSEWKNIGHKMGWLKKADFGTYGLGEEGDFGTPSPSGGPVPSESKPVKKPSQALEEAERWAGKISSYWGDDDDSGFSYSIDPALEALEKAAEEGDASHPIFAMCLKKMENHVKDFWPKQKDRYYKLKSMSEGK